MIVSEINGIIPEAMFAGDLRFSGKASLCADKESLDEANTAHFAVHRNGLYNQISIFRFGIPVVFSLNNRNKYKFIL